jgi:hypothetical protein
MCALHSPYLYVAVANLLATPSYQLPEVKCSPPPPAWESRRKQTARSALPSPLEASDQADEALARATRPLLLDLKSLDVRTKRLEVAGFPCEATGGPLEIVFSRFQYEATVFCEIIGLFYIICWHIM